MLGHQRSPDLAGRRFVWSVGTVLLAVHAILFLILAGILIGTPHAVEWIAEAVQSEFVGPDAPVMMPTQLALPIGGMWAIGID